MCGRTACILPPEEISKLCRHSKKDNYDFNLPWIGDVDKYHPSYNIAPQSYCPVLVAANHVKGDKITDCRCLMAMKWGLIPFWFKEKSGDKFSLNMNNARSDTLMQKKSYSSPLQKGQRCVVIANGFFEWKSTKIGKQPYYIYFPQDDGNKGNPHSQRLLTMAGIFEKNVDNKKDTYSFSVITVDASPDFLEIHHRMPALLIDDQEIEMWLDYENVSIDNALSLIKPKTYLQWHPVSQFVNNSRNDGPECIRKKEICGSSEDAGIIKWLRPVQLCAAEKKSSDCSLKKHKINSNLDSWLKKKKLN